MKRIRKSHTMLHVCRVLVLISINFIVIKCAIPSLNVHKVDHKVIARKRQDTMDMCRIFTVENQKLNGGYHKNSYQNGGKRRAKRDTGNLKSYNTIDVENAKRVENIIDKLYEDIVEDGEPVTYRQRNIETLTTAANVQNVANKTMRRFNFAPAELLGPLPQKPRGPNLEQGQPGPIDWHKRWKHGIVPYFIDSKTYDAHLADVIIKAFDYFEKATCIRLQRLKDRPTDKNSLQRVEWVYITNPSGIKQCVHSNERKPNIGVQMIVFGYDCLSTGEIIHEVMHILGFSHEHTRPDRDHHITILWNNIKPGYKKYFEVRPTDTLMNIPYDYASVLHYPPRAFSKNGQVTVMAQPGIRIGQREGLSQGDVQKVAEIFGNECVERNRQYLLKTCPSVVKANTESKKVTQNEIKDYFNDRLWPYGVVNYKIKDNMEFSAEERENIKAVIRHIEKETCIEFRDVTNVKEDDDDGDDDDDDDGSDINHRDKTETKLLNAEASGLSKETTTKTNNLGDSLSNKENKENQSDPEHDAKPPNNDDDDDGINKIPSNSENENTLRKGTQIPRNAKFNSLRRNRQKSLRRHAADILVLQRSAEPGCECPSPGRPRGNKILKINADCFNSVNDLLHLFVHLLGLDHQHNMHDRDSYLHILWNNLSPDIKQEMSQKLPPAASVGFEYDYQSVMHYPWLQIKDGVTNIMYPIWNDGWAMGHWQGLSATDVLKINLLYYDQCTERKDNKGEE